MASPDEPHNVRLHGWSEGVQKVSATKAIRRHVGLGLAEAKGVVDACLDGREMAFTFDSEKLAREFPRDMYVLGFLSEVTKRDGEIWVNSPDCPSRPDSIAR